MATTNNEIQAVVTQARTAAATNAPFDGARALAQIATVAAVQQDDLAADISTLSTRVAADPAADVSAVSNTLAQVRGPPRRAAGPWRPGACAGPGCNRRPPPVLAPARRPTQATP